MFQPSHNLPGTWTALITPFNQDESIDFIALKRLIEEQIAAGVTGILLNGTTGESPTLTDDEFIALVCRGLEMIAGRCFLMVGCGTNCTKKSITKAKSAEALGIDALMVVNPYYNKPTQEGLFLHFKSVADSVSLPIIVYNIKGRTAINLETKTLLRLIKEVPNIVGVKEASGDFNQIGDVCRHAPAKFTVLSGDDGVTFRIMRDYGAKGVVSVGSNLLPGRVVELVNFCLNGDFARAEMIEQELQPIFAGAFLETNPIPIKAALAMQGKVKEVYRLPLCSMMPTNRQRWHDLLIQRNIV
jgi:4-hydroxy-tetrahydrodipicolinate synthase